MAKVRLLPPEIAMKIAAGEVIERPASVLKELLENSIDAQAKKIAIEVAQGGKSLIKVTDDGEGMTEEDALLALKRHATSKLTQEEDLLSIHSFGFRGEALPSIAAISKLELVSRAQEEPSAIRVLIEGGQVKDVCCTGAPMGTTVTVKDLFFNTPARAKFLRSSSTELSHILDAVQRRALAFPSLALKVTSNSRKVVDFLPCQTLEQRIVMLFGQQFRENLLPLEHEAEGLKLEGFVGSPSLCSSSRAYQFLFFNLRPIVSPSLSRCVLEAYERLLMVHQYPVFFLFVTMDASQVDVNVHPTKREVRFAHEGMVRAQVKEAVRKALESPSSRTFSFPSQHYHQGSQASSWPQGEPVPMSLGKRPVPFPSRPGEASSPRAQHLSLLPLFYPSASGLTFIRQLFNSYLLCVDEERLIIIDQHALHERLLFEEWKRRATSAPLPSQRLLSPALMEFPPHHALLVKDNLQLFSHLAIGLEPFGGNTFQLVSIPSLLSQEETEQLIKELVQELASSPEEGKAFEHLLERSLTLLACKGAFKAGQPLTEAQIQELMDGFARLEGPKTCLHGRPIVTHLSLSELEQSFKRKG